VIWNVDSSPDDLRHLYRFPCAHVAQSAVDAKKRKIGMIPGDIGNLFQFQRTTAGENVRVDHGYAAKLLDLPENLIHIAKILNAEGLEGVFVVFTSKKD